MRRGAPHNGHRGMGRKLEGGQAAVSGPFLKNADNEEG